MVVIVKLGKPDTETRVSALIGVPFDKLRTGIGGDS
jgi:hypothetical protein